MRTPGRHRYDYAVDLTADTAAAWVVHMVGQGKRVLEIGAGPGSITRFLHETGQCRVTALEIDPEAIKQLAPFCERVYKVDLNEPNWPQALSEEKAFEVVVGADVLEHLYDPWSTLAAMKGLVQEGGYLVLSLPHVGHSAFLAALMAGDFEYRDWGLLDRTHIRFFGINNIEALVKNAGLKIVDAHFVVRPPAGTEFAKHWVRLPAEVRRALSTNRFGMVYQVVVKAVPQEAAGERVSLWSLPVTVPRFDVTDALGPAAGWLQALRVRLGPHLSPERRAWLRRVAKRLGLIV